MNNWWQYPKINNFGSYPDPEGAFPKPDVNIIAPSGTRFTAPFSGTVSGIDTTSPFGDVVTVNLDTPVNDSATHYAFLHLSSIAPGLFTGEHVNAGDLLGIGGGNQSTSGADPGFALTSSDQYGYGTGWSNNVQGTWINPQLNPTNLLDSLGSSGTNTSGGDCCNGDFWCTVCKTVSGGAGNPGTICCPGVAQQGASGAWQNIAPGLTQGGFIIFGAIIVILGLFLVFKG